MSPRITASHIRSRNAVNELRLLLESHGHIVEEVSGASDFGEDLRVSFRHGEERTGYYISIQVKSGRSFRASGGYRVPVKNHGDSWSETNLPVACVVHDPDERSFFWANATKQLRRASRKMHEARSIRISSEAKLDDTTVPLFVAEMLGYVGNPRDIAAAIEEFSGIAIGARDYIAYAPNAHGERMAFVQPFGAEHALLVHDDLEPNPITITTKDLILPGSSLHGELAAHELLTHTPLLLGDYILDMSEAMWLAACFMNSEWYRKEPDTRSDGISAEPEASAPTAEHGPPDEDTDVGEPAEEDEILRRIARRIAGSMAYEQRHPEFRRDPVPALEQFVLRRQHELLEDVGLLGFARNRSTRPIIEGVQRNFELTAPLLQGYITVGVQMNNLAIGKWRRPGRPKAIVDALMQIHARSLLIADEVFTLLHSGYPAGAQALCRTLYELAIVAKFISVSPALIAKRYMASHIVELHRRQKDEREDRIDELDPSVRTVWAELDQKYARILARYGDEMRFDNGWAWPAFATRQSGQPRKPGSIRFSEIEHRVGEAERRWRYHSASHYVHAVHLGTVKSLVVDTPGQLVLGPRPTGFAAPATDCLWDLHEVTEAFLRSVHRSSREPEVLYWLEVQTLAVTAMHSVVNEIAYGHLGFE